MIAVPRILGFSLAAGLAALASAPAAQAQSGGNERMPGGVERSQEPAAGAASDSVKPSTAPRMGTTRGLSAKPKPAETMPPPPAPVPPAAVPPTPRGVGGGAAPSAPATTPPKGKGYDETLPGGVERSPSTR